MINHLIVNIGMVRSLETPSVSSLLEIWVPCYLLFSGTDRFVILTACKWLLNHDRRKFADKVYKKIRNHLSDAQERIDFMVNGCVRLPPYYRVMNFMNSTCDPMLQTPTFASSDMAWIDVAHLNTVDFTNRLSFVNLPANIKLQCTIELCYRTDNFRVGPSYVLRTNWMREFSAECLVTALRFATFLRNIEKRVAELNDTLQQQQLSNSMERQDRMDEGVVDGDRPSVVRPSMKATLKRPFLAMAGLLHRRYNTIIRRYDRFDRTNRSSDTVREYVDTNHYRNAKVLRIGNHIIVFGIPADMQVLPRCMYDETVAGDSRYDYVLNQMQGYRNDGNDNDCNNDGDDLRYCGITIASV